MSRKQKITFVSSSDSRYYPMLREWVHSIRSFPQSKDMDICILDAGLTPEQIEQLTPHVTKILPLDWPFAISPRKIRGREFLKACVARPFIPKILPGYDVYFWMDPDTWVQRWDGVDLFLRGAEKGHIALTGQVDRAYPRQMRVKWLGRWPVKIKGFYFNNVRPAFGFRAAKKIMPYHVLLAGAFTLRADAPHWARWQDLVQKAARRGKVFTAEQTALGVLCYLENFPYEILPAWTHWLCEFKPVWDEDAQKFIEPFLPHEEIGILHLSGFDEMRVFRAEGTDIKTRRGETLHISLRYPPFNGEANEPVVHKEPDAHEVPRGQLQIAGKLSI